MEKRLSLIGSDHFNHDYNWLLGILQELKPDCITLEQKIDRSASLYWEFKHPLQKLLEEHKVRRLLLGEFAAGIHYARENNLPIYCIDEYDPFTVALLTNMNQGNNYEILNGRNHLGKRQEKDEDNFTNWTRRNKIMGTAINYHFLFSGYSNIAHIGGNGHYDETKCIALQTIAIADSIEIIDAVEKTRTFFQ